MVGNLVQGNRLASAQGRELGLMDNDDGMRRVSGLVFHAEGQGGLGNEFSASLRVNFSGMKENPGACKGAADKQKMPPD